VIEADQVPELLANGVLVGPGWTTSAQVSPLRIRLDSRGGVRCGPVEELTRLPRRLHPVPIGRERLRPWSTVYRPRTLQGSRGRWQGVLVLVKALPRRPMDTKTPRMKIASDESA
jgi:hypothetical protein